MQSVEDAASLLAVAADPIRWRILRRLAAQGTKCVCDLQPDVAVPQNVLSYHLKVLREAGLVTSEKRGRWIDYTLAGDAMERLQAALPVAGHPEYTASCTSCAQHAPVTDSETRTGRNQ